jgi:hypothetical protein
MCVTETCNLQSVAQVGLKLKIRTFLSLIRTDPWHFHAFLLLKIDIHFKCQERPQKLFLLVL